MKYSFVAAICVLVAPLTYAADLTGHWLASFQADGTVRETHLYLKADGDLLTGWISSNAGNEKIQDGKITGDTLSFSIVRDNFGEERRAEYTGKVNGESLTLTYPHPPSRPGRQVQFKQVSSAAPGEMPANPAKISLPAAQPVPYNGLAKTPPMGWNSWNKFADKVSDKLCAKPPTRWPPA